MDTHVRERENRYYKSILRFYGFNNFLLRQQLGHLCIYFRDRNYFHSVVSRKSFSQANEFMKKKIIKAVKLLACEFTNRSGSGFIYNCIQ